MRKSKIIIGVVAILTAGGLLAVKHKMRHHYKHHQIENCHKMMSSGCDMKH